MMTSIYTLTDPITNMVRYVGQTRRGLRRKYEHNSVKNSPKYAKDKWVKKLNSKCLKPIYEVIDEVENVKSNEMEIHYIRLYKSFGAHLLNLTLGGDASLHVCENHNSKYTKGKTLTEIYGVEKAEEIRSKIKHSSQKENNPNWGKKFPNAGDKSRELQSKTPICILDRNDKVLGVFKNSHDASLFIGCRSSKIRMYKAKGWYVNRKYLIKDLTNEI